MSEIETSSIFHVGILVPDLEEAMGRFGDGLGLTWCEVTEREQSIWTPEGGTETTPLRFTYSRQGPSRIELLQGTNGSFWDWNTNPTGTHHLGVWTSDVSAEVERLTSLGWTLEAAQHSPEDGYGSMAYLRSTDGTLIEPVSVAAKPRFERWWAGGSL